MEREASRKHAITNYLAAMYVFTGIGRFNKQELDTELYPSSRTDLKGGLESCISPLLARHVSEGQGFVLPWQQLIASLSPEAAQGPAAQQHSKWL